MRYLLPLLLAAAPAFAQQATYEPTHMVLLQQAMKCEQIASSQYQQFTAERAAKDKQIAELIKERDELKAKADH